MIKLLKYELMRSFLPFVIVGLIFLVGMTIIGSYAKNISLMINDSSMDTLFLLGVLLAISACFGLLIIQILAIINSFGKNLFGNYGYLLFCVPESLDSILFSKILSNLILIGASSLFYVFVSFEVFVQLSNMSLPEMFRSFLKLTTHIDPLLVILMGFYFLGSILHFLTQILLTLCILNSTHISSFRFVIGLLIYLGISIAGVLILLPLQSVAAIFIGNSSDTILNYINSLDDASANWNPMWYAVGIYWILEAVFLSSIYYFCSRYLIYKKLELI